MCRCCSGWTSSTRWCSGEGWRCCRSSSSRPGVSFAISGTASRCGRVSSGCDARCGRGRLRRRRCSCWRGASPRSLPSPSPRGGSRVRWRTAAGPRPWRRSRTSPRNTGSWGSPTGRSSRTAPPPSMAPSRPTWMPTWRPPSSSGKTDPSAGAWRCGWPPPTSGTTRRRRPSPRGPCWRRSGASPRCSRTCRSSGCSAGGGRRSRRRSSPSPVSPAAPGTRSRSTAPRRSSPSCSCSTGWSSS